jgi:hypothetical protein
MALITQIGLVPEGDDVLHVSRTPFGLGHANALFAEPTVIRYWDEAKRVASG